MGKGDKRTKRGKIYRSSYGNTRLKKKKQRKRAAKAAAAAQKTEG